MANPKNTCPKAFAAFSNERSVVSASPIPVKVCDYLYGGCNVNSLSVLRGMKDAGIDISEAEVLFLTHVDFFNRHFVVRYRNYIYDADLAVAGEEVFPHGDHRVPPIPIKTYFSARHADHDAMVRVIPGPVYLDEYAGYGFEYFNRYPEVPYRTYLGSAVEQ